MNLFPGYSVNGTMESIETPINKAAAAAVMDLSIKNGDQWKNWIAKALRPYFHVNNRFVAQRIGTYLMPFFRSDWSRTRAQSVNENTLTMVGLANPYNSSLYTPGSPLSVHSENVVEYYCLPKHDNNAPDLYVPSMAYVTMVVLAATRAGLNGTFHSEILGIIAPFCLFMIFLQALVLCLGSYILSIANYITALDMFAYLGYSHLYTSIFIALTFISYKLAYIFQIWTFITLTYTLGRSMDIFQNMNQVKNSVGVNLLVVISCLHLLSDWLLLKQIS